MNTRVSNFSKEAFLMYAARVIEGFETLTATFKVISEVGSTKFDGKVFNARFEHEIENVLKERNICAMLWLNDQYNMGYKDLKISLQDPLRSIRIGESWFYIDNDVTSSNIHNCNKEFVDENGRVIGEKLIETCNKYIEQSENYKKRWQDAIDNYDTYAKRVKEAVTALGMALKGVNDFFLPSEICRYDWQSAAEAAEKQTAKEAKALS